MRPWLLLVAILEAVLIVVLLLTRGAGEAAPQLSTPETLAGAREATAAPIVSPHAAEAIPTTPAAADAAPVTRSAVAANEPADLDELLGLLVFGTVRDTAAKPVKDYWLSLGRGKANEQWNAQRTPRGYCVSGLEPGRFKLRVRSDGHLDLDREVELTAGQRWTRLDLVLTPATVVRVKVLTPEGQPFLVANKGTEDQPSGWRTEPAAVATVEPLPRGAQANLWDQSVSDWRPARDFPPERQLAKEYLGELTIKRSLPVHVSLVFAALVLETTRVEVGQQEVEFRVGPATLKGLLASLTVRVVRDSDGQPLDGVNVALGEGGYGPGNQARTDKDGRARLADLRPGAMRLAVHGSKEFERWERPITIEPGKEFDAGTVRLRGPAPIRGKVFDATGKPVSAQLNLLAMEGGDGTRATEWRWGGRSDAEGEFALTQVPRGRFLLRGAEQRTRETGWVAVDNSGGAVDGVRLDLRASAALTLRPKGEWRGWAWSVVTGDGLVVTTGRLWEQEQNHNLPPGSYTLQLAHANKGQQKSLPFTLPATGLTLEVP